jgi:hypothetical protein
MGQSGHVSRGQHCKCIAGALCEQQCRTSGAVTRVIRKLCLENPCDRRTVDRDFPRLPAR